MQISRRSLLAGGSMAAGAAVGSGAGTWAAPAAAAVPLRSRSLFTGGFPRTFLFRQSEVLAQLRGYEDWAAPFADFPAMMLKALPEERTDTVTSRNLAYVDRFKREHPDVILLLHYDGVARVPGYRTGSWFAGDWLHFAGATVTGAVAATDTAITVDDATQFSAPVGRYGEVGDDLVLTGRTPDGRPDWTRAEQVVVTAVDRETRTLTIARGQYASEPISLPAGGYVARHLTNGPWSAQDDKMWLYNYATNAPRGPDGRSVGERIAAEMAEDFGPTGVLRRFDGIELDVFVLLARRAELPTIDTDGDGVGDGGYVGPDDVFLAGQVEFLQRLRTAVGPGRLVLSDGGSSQLPDRAVVGGIEIEGFPRQNDPTLAFWSASMSSLDLWTAQGRAPRLSYPLAKSFQSIGDATDFARFRISLAASLLAGSQFTFWDEPGGTSLTGLRPPPDSGQFADTFTVWDELRDEGGRVSGWLGLPLGPATWLASAAPDLLAGAGVDMPPEWVRGLTASGARVRRIAGPELSVDPASPSEAFSVSVPVPGFVGGDIVVMVDLATRAGAPLPRTVPRLLTITVSAQRVTRSSQHSVLTAHRSVRTYARGLPAGPLTVTVAAPAGAGVRVRNLRVVSSADAGHRLFEHGAVFANPALEPYTFDTTGLGSFVRLTASPDQDPAANDGTPVGSTLTVPPIDALVVRRA